MQAAMEPRRDDGDDHTKTAGRGGIHHAAMEPRRDDGDDTTMNAPIPRVVRPQWSPVVTTGTTREARTNLLVYM